MHPWVLTWDTTVTKALSIIRRHHSTCMNAYSAYYKWKSKLGDLVKLMKRNTWIRNETIHVWEGFPKVQENTNSVCIMYIETVVTSTSKTCYC